MPNFSIFGVGTLEILVVLVLALIVIGPQRLPETAAHLGGMVRTLRRYANEFRREFVDEFGDLRADWEMSQKEYREVVREVSEASSDVRATTGGVNQDVARATSEVNAALRGQPIDATARLKAIEPPANVIAIGEAATRRPADAPAEPAPEAAAKAAPSDATPPRLQRH